MQHGTRNWLTLCATTAAMACATQPQPVVTTTTSSSAGEVALQPAGMWMDSVGGTWMDSSGVFQAGRSGIVLGLQPADFAGMTDANIVAHLAMGDSLEIELSKAGTGRAQNQAVRNFAQRMVTEHSQHLQMGQQMASQAGIAPTPLPADTAEAQMATRMMNRIANAPVGADYDRQLMRAEVMMHQHMLHELNAVRPQASGTTRQLVEQTIPVVQQHLNDAQSIWKQVGGGMNGADNMHAGHNMNGSTTP